MELTHIATREGKLSSFLREELHMSSGLVNRLKCQARLLVNGEPRFTNYMVQPGDCITVIPTAPEPEYPAEYAPLTVLYEDEAFLAVDKPAGMLIHPSHCQNTGTLANRVLGYYRRSGQSCAFHPVTRLDRDTFGVVLLAKSSHIHARTQQLPLEKIYHALVWGVPLLPEGEISAPIARCPAPSLLRQIHPEGKPALTRYRILASGEHCAKLALQPVTGRTHQLRLHCLHAGFPILGDPQYYTEGSLAASRQLGLASQQLCAASVTFLHPLTGQSICVSSRMDTADPLIWGQAATGEGLRTV